MSLRLRVTLFIAVAVAAAVVAVSWAAYASAQHEARSEIDQALLSRVAPLGGPGATVSPSDEPMFTGAGTDTGVAVRPDVLMQIVDASGAVFAPFAGATPLPVDEADVAVAAGEEATLLRDVRIDGVHYRMVTTQAVALWAIAPGQPGELVPVAVQVARDLTETDAFLGGLRTRLLLIGGSAVLAAGVVAWFVSRRAVQPVARLTEAAEHVAATRELEVPIRVNRRRDELGRLATSFNSMLAALASSRAQQRRLVADAGHELRTPLTSLRTNMELLARAPNLPAGERTEVLSDARHELEELSALVGELLDLAADAPPEQSVSLRLDEVVGEAVERFRRRTGREVVLAAEPTQLVGKPVGLARAVANLLDNAQKWSPAGAAVEVSVRGGRVEVRDHGPGIDPADLPHVFERFYRSAAARGTPGSGLGLAIVQQVAEEHGGRAFAAGAQGGGALVGFEIPASVPSPPAPEPAGPSQEMPSA
jgi:two-component system sensor histidine kinase MprB